MTVGLAYLLMFSHPLKTINQGSSAPTEDETMKIIGLSGSLKKHSLHTALLEQAALFLPGHAEFSIASINLPLYNEDIDNTIEVTHQTPDDVIHFKQQIAEADGLIIATPEYNHSVSGPLKNALDWVSRPAFDSPLKEKPIAIFSASPSPVGGVRGQAHLRLILASTLSHVLPAIEYSVANVHQMVDENNRLIDANALRRLQRFVSQFMAFAEKMVD